MQKFKFTAKFYSFENFVNFVNFANFANKDNTFKDKLSVKKTQNASNPKV